MVLLVAAGDCNTKAASLGKRNIPRKRRKETRRADDGNQAARGGRVAPAEVGLLGGFNSGYDGSRAYQTQSLGNNLEAF